MARWRQAIELAMTAEEIGRLATIARSRSEAARRVQRAQILLSRSASWPASRTLIDTLSSTHGPTGSPSLPDMIRLRKR
jgi:hypothetical protein